MTTKLRKGWTTASGNRQLKVAAAHGHRMGRARWLPEREGYYFECPHCSWCFIIVTPHSVTVCGSGANCKQHISRIYNKTSLVFVR